MSEAKELTVLATVGTHEITNEDVDAYISVLPPQQQGYAQIPQFREQVLQELISMQLMALKAEDEKLDTTEEFKRNLAFYRGQLLAQMVQAQVLEGLRVTNSEAQEYYEANKAQFNKGESVRARHILVESEESCNAILAELQSGATTFEAAAAAHSTCPSGQQGGDLGEFGHGQMVQEFDQAAFAAEVDELVGPVKTQFGYHLIQVYAKNEAQTPAFEEVKETVARTLLQQKQTKAFTDLINELKAKYMN